MENANKWDQGICDSFIENYRPKTIKSGYRAKKNLQLDLRESGCLDINTIHLTFFFRSERRVWRQLTICCVFLGLKIAKKKMFGVGIGGDGENFHCSRLPNQKLYALSCSHLLSACGTKLRDKKINKTFDWTCCRRRKSTMRSTLTFVKRRRWLQTRLCPMRRSHIIIICHAASCVMQSNSSLCLLFLDRLSEWCCNQTDH